jgi:hypothetical protein
LAKKTTKPVIPLRQSPVQAEAQSLWNRRLFPFLNSHSVGLALGLIAIASLRIASTYPQLCFTIDEPQHFACGLEYLVKHVYRYETQHPPLSRAAMALLPYLDGAKLTDEPDRDKAGLTIMYGRGTPQRTLTLMRLGILPFFMLASFVVFLWARRHFGGAIAVMATGIFTLEPSVLGHGGLATTDMTFTACFCAAFLAMLVWAEAPSRRTGLLLGMAIGLMLLSKFTALVYFPSAAGLALLFYLLKDRTSLPKILALGRARAASFGLALGVAALFVWAGYFFSFGRVPGTSISVPAPELFDGIRTVIQHNDRGHGGYLFGHISPTGFWYFFPAVLAVKTPLALLLLLIPGVWYCCRRAPTSWVLPLAFSLGVLLPAMAGQINIGVRHILPIYAGLSIIGAVALERLADSARAGKWAALFAAVAVLWLAGTGIYRHPHYVSYFNELADRKPENVLVDSDLDWGQDYVQVAARLRELGASQVTFLQPGVYLKDYLLKWPGFPPIKPVQPLIPSEGWTVVSPTADKTFQYGLNFKYPNLQPWFDSFQPKERIGGMLLYYLPPGSVRFKGDPSNR